MTEDSFSLEDRILCSDGMCIGVIGPDGRCGECAKPYEGDEPLPDFDSAPVREIAEDDGPLPPLDTPDSGSSDAIDPADRICCSDETCIGIIGDNGKCGTCGRLP